MIHASPPFPNHKFDFQDSVSLPHLRAGGIVEGIWYHQGTWHYHVRGLACQDWWTEHQLVVGCPHCFATVPPDASACPACGNPLD